MIQKEYSVKQSAAWIAFVCCLLLFWNVSTTFASTPLSVPAPSLPAEEGKKVLEGIAMCTVALLIGLFIVEGQDRKLARTARKAGLRVSGQPRIPAIGYQERRGRSTERTDPPPQIMIIGSTGRSFSEPGGELHQILRGCGEARIMLLDPREYGALARSEEIADPEITPEVIREEIMMSIGFIKDLNKSQNRVKLKLYPEVPLLKLAIIGDYASVRHYHTGLNVRDMPEFVFQKTGQHGGLYLAFCRYFASRWQDPDIPEYDLESDELIYRDQLEYEVLREPYLGAESVSGEEQMSGEGRRSPFIFR